MNLSVYEVDERGDCIALVRFDDDAEGAAYAELDARWGAGLGAGHAAAAAWMRGLRAGLEQRDWDALAGSYAPGFVGHDHGS